jgi:hypothetical protein
VTTTLAKTVLTTGQATWLIVLGGYILFRTQWVVLPSFVAIVILMRMQCKACSTPFTNERVYRHFKLLRFWDTRIIDRCPICSGKMFN